MSDLSIFDELEAEEEAERQWHQRLQEALGCVLTLVAGGVEYPDASVTVSIEHRLRPFDTTIIARAYDWLDEHASADFARAIDVGIERATKEMFDD